MPKGLRSQPLDQLATLGSLLPQEGEERLALLAKRSHGELERREEALASAEADGVEQAEERSDEDRHLPRVRDDGLVAARQHRPQAQAAAARR